MTTTTTKLTLPYPRSASILVLRDCPCRKCQDPDTRWWRTCTAREPVAKYALPVDGDGNVAYTVRQWQVVAQQLLADHPGCVFVYI